MATVGVRMTNRHDHVTGRPRDYISRKWFHRGRHRPAAHRTSVEELVAKIKLRDLKPVWRMSDDGGYYIFEGSVYLTGQSAPGFVMISTPDEIASIPTIEEP